MEHQYPEKVLELVKLSKDGDLGHFGTLGLRLTSEAGGVVRLVSYNIQYGKGKDGNYDLHRIVNEVRGADVIALQEVERFWHRSGMVDQPRAIASLLPEYWWVYGAGVDLALEQGNPTDCRRRQFGNMLLARSQIAMSRNHLLPKYSTARAMSLQRSALEGVVQISGEWVRIYSVHLTHLSSYTRLPQVEKLIQVHRDAVSEGSAITGRDMPTDWADEGVPPSMPANAIMMGDFNFEFDSAEYELLVGPISDYGDRLSNTVGFVDSWEIAGHRVRDAATTDVQGRPAKLDYCFLSTVLSERLVSAEIDRTAQGSDHQPIWIELLD